MAKRIDVPFTETDVSASSDGARDVGRLTLGFSVLTIAGAVGVMIGKRALETGSSALGVGNPASDDGVNIEV